MEYVLTGFAIGGTIAAVIVAYAMLCDAIDRFKRWLKDKWDEFFGNF